MECVAPGLRDDADLAAGTGAELGRVIVRFHAEFLDIFQAALQLEWRYELSADDTGFSIDNPRCFDTIETDRILLSRTSVKANVPVLAVACVLRSRRL